MRDLSQLAVGEQAIVLDIAANDSKMKLMEMGCIPGVSVKVLHRAPLNGPIAIEVSGYILSLRLQEAKYIYIS